MKTRIKDLRLEKQYSQEYLARISGTTQTALSKIERGFIVPDAQLITHFADHFQVSSDYLLYRSDHRVSTETLLSNQFHNIDMYRSFILLLQEMNPEQRRRLFHFLQSFHDAPDPST